MLETVFLQGYQTQSGLEVHKYYKSNEKYYYIEGHNIQFNNKTIKPNKIS